MIECAICGKTESIIDDYCHECCQELNEIPTEEECEEAMKALSLRDICLMPPTKEESDKAKERILNKYPDMFKIITDFTTTIEVRPKNMNNLEQMHKILGLKEDEKLPELQNLVVKVKQSINGASDPWSTEALKRTKEALEMRMTRWHYPSDVIDSCIYTMCLEAVRLINKELKERKS